jgi:hypothetical protein
MQILLNKVLLLPEFRKLLFSLLFIITLVLSAPAIAAEVFFSGLVQEYDGGVKSPVVTTDPPGLQVSLEYFPRSNSGEIFRNIPVVGQPSYTSYGLNRGFNNSTLHALGDVVNPGGANRRLESIDVSLVSWSRAANWPALAASNPEGYLHPLTLTVYRVVGEDLFLLAEQTGEFLIPWRPATLDDGGEYPFGGTAFTARFNFSNVVTLSGKLAILISYNTGNGGFEPLGVEGPYDSLNVALSDEPVLVGSDDDSSRMLVHLPTGISKLGSFGTLAPMFVVRAFPPTPTGGIPQDAGGYLVQATITEPGLTGEAVEDFQIRPQEVDLELIGMRQSADGAPKTVTVTNPPTGVSVDVVFSERDKLPVERGLYPVFVSLRGGNFSGRRSGVMRLGYSFESWAAEKISSSGERARDRDPDGDGRGNFDEYLSATDPADALDFKPVSLQLSPAPGGLVLGFFRNNEATDVEYLLEQSGDLGETGGWDEFPLMPEATHPFVDNEFIEVPLDPSKGSPRFFRLRYQSVGGSN